MTAATDRDVEQLSAGLAEAFRTGVPGDLFTSDFFLDGHPPFWWFQIQGLDGFTAWLEGYVAHGPAVDVVTDHDHRGRLPDRAPRVRDRAGPWLSHRPPAARLHRARRTDRRDDRVLQRRLGREHCGHGMPPSRPSCAGRGATRSRHPPTPDQHDESGGEPMSETMTKHVPDSAEDVLAAIESLAPEVSARAAETEAARRLPPDLVALLASSGCFGILLPRSHGGVEGTLADQLHAVEALARADASVGWTVMIGSSAWSTWSTCPAPPSTSCSPSPARSSRARSPRAGLPRPPGPTGSG